MGKFSDDISERKIPQKGLWKVARKLLKKYRFVNLGRN
jgi:hypothetical protein